MDESCISKPKSRLIEDFDAVSATNAAGPDNVRVNAHARKIAKIAEVDGVEFGNGLKNRWLERHVFARERRNDAAWTWDRDFQQHFRTDRDSLAGP